MEIDKSDTICQATMQALNEQRKDNSLYDVNIIVKGQNIKAHRCVLVAGSEYFKSLFCGPMKQDVSEVCLSEVTDDVDSACAVIDFLYTGKIIIDDVNLEGVLKLSSFLLVTILREMCVEYMKTKLNLDRCLHYYLLSVDHMLPEITQELSKTVLSRFHDCHIFKDSALSMSPSQLRYLMESYDIFEHCFILDIISFVIDWVRIGDTDEHEQIGCEVLEYISRMPQLSNNRDLFDKEKRCSILAEKLPLKIDGVPQFTAKLNCIIGDYLKKPLNGAHPSDLQTVSLDPNNTLPESLGRLQDNEHVLIAIAPNQHLVDQCKGWRYWVPCGRTVFNICIYVPSRKRWYYLTEGKNRETFHNMARFKAEVTRSFIMYNNLCFISPYAPSISMFDMRSFTWSKLSFEKVIKQAYIRYEVQDVYFTTSKDGLLYMVLREWLENLDGNMTVFFICYQYSPTNVWKFVGRKYVTYTPAAQKHDSRFSAAISASGKEMILVFATVKLYVFAFDLHSEQTSDFTLRYFQQDIILSDSYSILEIEDYFCIVEDAATDNEPIKYRCRCRYQVGSNKLSTDVTTEIATDVFDISMDKDKYKGFPCKPFFCTPGKKYMWLFEGDCRERSSLKALSFVDENPMAVYTHTPPPFPCITDMVTGDISREILDSLTPIRTYLHTQTQDNSGLSNEGDPLGKGDLNADGDYNDRDDSSSLSSQ